MLPDKGIDWNRGVTSKIHKKSGIWVNMYKDQPGIFYDMRGGLVQDSIARDCGFNIASLKKQAARKKAVQDSLESIEAEYSDANEQEVLYEAGDYKVVASPNGHAEIYDADGFHCNTVKMKRSEAIALVKRLTEPVEEEKVS